jgi:hypothetical protein
VEAAAAISEFDYRDREKISTITMERQRDRRRNKGDTNENT